MKWLLLLFLLNGMIMTAHEPLRVYLFPGLGSDARIFEEIVLDSNYRVIHITYPVPAKGCSMSTYAKLLTQQIDTNGRFILIGVSIGGMLCAELADFIRAEKVIVISSAKCRAELPFRYRFQKTIPLNSVVPAGTMKWGARILQPLVEPDRNKRKEIFKSMLRDKNKIYLKRSVNMIIRWEKKEFNKNIVHIHGTRDHTLPFRLIKTSHVVQDGSHMMTLTRGKELNQLLVSILNSKPGK